jgi:hypothetical protein
MTFMCVLLDCNFMGILELVLLWITKFPIWIVHWVRLPSLTLALIFQDVGQIARSRICYQMVLHLDFLFLSSFGSSITKLSSYCLNSQIVNDFVN